MRTSAILQFGMIAATAAFKAPADLHRMGQRRDATIIGAAPTDSSCPAIVTIVRVVTTSVGFCPASGLPTGFPTESGAPFPTGGPTMVNPTGTAPFSSGTAVLSSSATFSGLATATDETTSETATETATATVETIVVGSSTITVFPETTSGGFNIIIEPGTTTTDAAEVTPTPTGGFNIIIQK